MERIEADEEKLKADLASHWETISEGAQSILRASGKVDAYESLKTETRGRVLDEGSYRRWAQTIEVDEQTRERLLNLSPEKYIGLAIEITDDVIRSSDIHRET
jgi:adenylosuccinate lyase